MSNSTVLLHLSTLQKNWLCNQEKNNKTPIKPLGNTSQQCTIRDREQPKYRCGPGVAEHDSWGAYFYPLRFRWVKICLSGIVTLHIFTQRQPYIIPYLRRRLASTSGCGIPWSYLENGTRSKLTEPRISSGVTLTWVGERILAKPWCQFSIGCVRTLQS